MVGSVCRRWVAVLVALVVVLAGAVTAPTAAVAAPNFKAPFDCGSVWRGSTYSGHGYAADFATYSGSTNASNGKPVRASADGTVIASLVDSVGGNMVRVRHGSSGWSTYYGHLSQRLVSQGQEVRTGDLLGYVGNTGTVIPKTFYHLHYEQENPVGGAAQQVRFDGVAISLSPNGGSPSAPAITSTNCGTTPQPPAPPADRDGDGVPDVNDVCVADAGTVEFSGCPRRWVEGAPQTGTVDFDGDGNADYCRRVGGTAYPETRLACTRSRTGNPGESVISGPLDWGYNDGAAWADFNGDGRADYCRLAGGTGNFYLICTLSEGIRFGKTISSGKIDPGFATDRVWADVNGDGRADYCRRTGGTNLVNSRIACTVSAGTAFGTTFESGTVDWGYNEGRAWADFDGDGRSDYCRVVGMPDNMRVQCTVSTGSGFGATYTSDRINWGDSLGRAWTDFNGDGRADYCRVVGSAASKRIGCLLSSGDRFGLDVTSGSLDWGYGTGRVWVDVTADGRADFCRRVGNDIAGQRYISCTVSSGTTFGTTVTSPSLDWGYTFGRTWADANGDGAADYCRVVGDIGNERIACTSVTAKGFGATTKSNKLDWGYHLGRAWAGSSGRKNLTGVSTSTVNWRLQVGSTIASPQVRTRTVGVRPATQWLRNGSAIKGATRASYTLTAADLGKRISARVTVSKAGYRSVSWVWSTKGSVQAGSLASSSPKIKGAAKRGKSLRANPGAWTSGTQLTYRWLRNGKAIKGATKSTYKLTKKDRGKRISVRVAGKKAGYSTVTRTSKATKKVRR